MTRKTEDVADKPEVEAEAADHGLDPSDPAVTGVPRDERHDSIDPHTGTLTAEAVALRAEQTAEGASER